MKHYDTVLLCLHLMVGFCCTAACNLPTESDPFSLCAYCSDRQAGVRWMIHESNNRGNPYRSGTYDIITIEFQCRDPQNDTVYQHDDCFDGTRLSALRSYDPGEWNWYILERELNNGTECSFETTLENSVTGSSSRLTLTSTCTVKECSEDSSDTDCTLTSSSPIPAICSAEGEPMDSECSCSCNNPGFTISRTIHGTTTLQCKNVDECATGSHQCEDERDCVDSEGGYSCLPVRSNQLPRSSSITGTSSELEIEPTATVVVESPTSYYGPSVTTLMPPPPASESDDNTIMTPSPTLKLSDGTSMQVSHSLLVSDTAHVTEAGADIKLLIAIPLSVVVLIVLVVISLLFIIALNKYCSNDSVHKSISFWQAQDKFDPEFTPAVEIDRNFSVKYSPTQESIVMSLKHITDKKGEHVLCTDQDAEKESITSTCNNESQDNNIITAHEPTIIQSNGATDSGIVLNSDQNQNSSNYQDKSASSFPSISFGYVTDPRCCKALVPVHPSGANPGLDSQIQAWSSCDSGYRTASGANPDLDSQTQAWSFCDSGYKRELESQNPLEPLTGHGGTTTDEYVHEHAQLQISIAVNSSNSTSPELDEMNGLLSTSSESSSCFHDIDTTLTPDDHDATDDHMINANADSTGCNISANDYATELQMPCSEIAENYSSMRHSGGGIPLGSYTNTTMRLPGMDGSSLSIMCDTDFQDSIDTSTCII